VQLADDYQTLVPCLAVSWSVAENELDYKFRLRSGVKFHDGSLLTARVASFSIARQIELRPEYILFSVIDTVTALDELTLSIRLKHPYPPFLYSLAAPNGLMIISKQAIEKYGSQIGRHPCGTGPFYLHEWLNNEFITLKRFPAYRESGEVEEVVFRHPKDNSESEVWFKEGRLDVLYMVAAFWLDRLRWLGDVDYFVKKPLNTLFLGFNMRSKAMQDPLIRRAILLSIDRKKVTLIANRGNAIVAEGPLPPIYRGFDDLQQESLNREKARHLLEKAGYKNGLVLNLYVPAYTFSRNIKIELIRSELKKSRINLVTRYFEDTNTYRLAIVEDSCHLFFDGYGSELIGDPVNFLYTLFYSSSSYNWGGYHNKLTDQMLNQSLSENDEQKRHLLYRKIIQSVLSDVPSVFISHVKSHFAYNTEKIKSLAVSPYEYIYFNRLKLRN
jgi:peptide/nickel transport system substrate-binding protein